MIGEAEFWQAIDELRSEMGEHLGDGTPAWETWCEKHGIDWEDLRAASNAYLPSFEKWLNHHGCLAHAAVDMWLHAFQVGFLVASDGTCESEERSERG